MSELFFTSKKIYVMSTEEINPFKLPENTANEIIDKIHALAVSIRMDWSDPRSECRKIYELCDKLKVIINI